MLSHRNWIRKYILHASIYVKLRLGKLFIVTDWSWRDFLRWWKYFLLFITMVVVVMDTFVKHVKLTFSMGAVLLYMNYGLGKSIFFKRASRNYVLIMLKGFRIYEASGCRERKGGGGWLAWSWHAPISREGFWNKYFERKKADQGKLQEQSRKLKFTYWEKKKSSSLYFEAFFFWLN